MFNPNLPIGAVLTENEVHNLFECQTTLGIRMSVKNNLFVIMSGSAKRKVYEDYWLDDILYYNGTDISADENGNQSLKKGKGNNNLALKNVFFEQGDKKHQLFLFTKREVNKCVFQGEVELISPPYTQPRHDDPSKKVLIFPLKLKSSNLTSELQDFEKKVESYSEESLDSLLEKIKAEEGKATKHKNVTSYVTTYYRDPKKAAYTKIRANGICDLCNEPAPFNDKNGKPYLESHHVVWLSNGGEDKLSNLVALCPNCHKKMHIVKDQRDLDYLLNKVSDLN